MCKIIWYHFLFGQFSNPKTPWPDQIQAVLNQQRRRIHPRHAYHRLAKPRCRRWPARLVDYKRVRLEPEGARGRGGAEVVASAEPHGAHHHHHAVGLVPLRGAPLALVRVLVAPQRLGAVELPHAKIAREYLVVIVVVVSVICGLVIVVVVVMMIMRVWGIRVVVLGLVEA